MKATCETRVSMNGAEIRQALEAWLGERGYTGEVKGARLDSWGALGWLTDEDGEITVALDGDARPEASR